MLPTHKNLQQILLFPTKQWKTEYCIFHLIKTTEEYTHVFILIKKYLSTRKLYLHHFQKNAINAQARLQSSGHADNIS